MGQLVMPDSGIYWMSHYVGPCFVEHLEGDDYTLYITGRDDQNRSRIGCAHITIENYGLKLQSIDPNPKFDLGEIGCFDESGVSYPWILNIGDIKCMYYVGWVAGGLARFQNYTGLAISEDNGATYHRYQCVPILERTNCEPYGSGSCAVYERNGSYEMMYTAFEPWGERHGRMQPSYNIKIARSDDGFSWHRDGEVMIDFANPEEFVIGKPMPLIDDGLYRLWYSYRGASYRIGYAESLDGVRYKRMDDRVGISVSESGWDSEMVEYSFVFCNGDHEYMLYNGNQFGRTGLGWAVRRG